MPYTKQDWTDESPQEPVRYSINDDVAGEVAASAEIAVVSSVTAGSPVNAERLNYMEDGIEAAHDAADAAAALAVAFKTAKVQRATEQTISNATPTLISFDDEEGDVGGFFNPASPTIFTIPEDGWYLVGAHAKFDTDPDGDRKLELLLNGALTVDDAFEPNGGSVTTRQLKAQTLLLLSQNDEISARVTHTAGNDLNVRSTVDGDSTAMWIIQVGAV